MPNIDRVLARKWRLTDRLRRADLARMERDEPERPKRWLRTRLHRCDVLLERAGYFR